MVKIFDITSKFYLNVTSKLNLNVRLGSMCKDKVVCLYHEILNKIVKQASAGDKDIKLVTQNAL